MSIDKERLKDLAKTASRYEWSRKSLDLSHKFPPDYELYIVECSPYTILALLAEIEALSKIKNGARLVSDDLCGEIQGLTDENNRIRDLASNLQKLFREANETISKFYLEIKMLKAENEQLRKEKSK